jgi:circadian clock protein KaiB
MEIPEQDKTTAAFERALKEHMDGCFDLRLYVSGSTPRSILAIANIKDMCERYLPGRYNLEIIDIYQQPAIASGEQIIAIPTLVKRLPLPLRKLIGDMSDTNRILLSLDISSKG